MTDQGRAAFAALHCGPGPLLLPNAWDVASARLFVVAGHHAVGTTSLGICAAAGLPDAARASRSHVVRLARALADLPCPVSVDLEDGYADEPDGVAELVSSLPVAGVNLEDSRDGRLDDPRRLAATVLAVKRRCPDVFVNARVDTYWLGEEADLATTTSRALRYVAAGADGVFVPGALADGVIEALSMTFPVPLNVLQQVGRDLADLATLGVRRVSTGSLPYRAALAAALDAVRAAADGTAWPDAVPYGGVQSLAALDGSGRLERFQPTVPGVSEPDGA